MAANIPKAASRKLKAAGILAGRRPTVLRADEKEAYRKTLEKLEKDRR